MDNQDFQDAVVEQAHEMKSAVEAIQSETQKVGEQSMAAAKDLGDNVRAMVEKTLAESRTRFAKTKSALAEASVAIETSLGAAHQGVTQLNAKAIAALKSDAEANFNLLTSAAAAKSLSELVTLNTEFVRKRFEEATVRAKDFSEFARKVADEAGSPIREQVAKTFKFAV